VFNFSSLFLFLFHLVKKRRDTGCWGSATVWSRDWSTIKNKILKNKIKILF
jgi:hypothetical protein